MKLESITLAADWAHKLEEAQTLRALVAAEGGPAIYLGSGSNRTRGTMDANLLPKPSKRLIDVLIAEADTLISEAKAELAALGVEVAE